jgi:hypothetical protein
MAYDWNGNRTRRIVIAKRLTLAALVALLVALALAPILGGG